MSKTHETEPLPRARPGENRYPLEPLVQALRHRLDDFDSALDGRMKPTARYLRVPTKTLWRWGDAGVTYGQLEELCFRVNLHPYDVWPQLATELLDEQEARRRARDAAWHRQRRLNDPALAEAERVRARAYYAECGEAVRKAERRRYWQDPEAQRARKRRYRQRPEVRERERARSRAYYQANAETLRAAERARKQARRARTTAA